MNRYLILTLTSWLLMLLPVAMLLQRVMQAEHYRLVWASLALAPFVAWFSWQAISTPLPKVRFAVLQWLGVGYSLAIALIIAVPLFWVPMTAIKRMRAGRIDQKGPRVRVTKMVR